MAVRHPGRKPSGTAATEFLLTAVPLLLAGLGAVEAARWYLVRQAVGQALLEAARAGATRHAEPAAMHESLRQGLLPLHASAATSAGMAIGRQRLDRRSRRLSERYGLAPWHLEILSPRRAHFQDFAVFDPGGGSARIPNSYQAERHHGRIADGSPDGRGTASGETLFEANTLTLRLTYPHPPLVPGLGSLLRALGRAAPAGGYAGRAMRDAGLLPIRQEVSVAMQSDVHWWPGSDTGRPPTADRPGTSAFERNACTGIWCQSPGGATDAPAMAAPPPGRSESSGGDGDGGDSEPAAPPPPARPEDGCGIVLCCV